MRTDVNHQRGPLSAFCQLMIYNHWWLTRARLSRLWARTPQFVWFFFNTTARRGLFRNRVRPLTCDLLCSCRRKRTARRTTGTRRRSSQWACSPRSASSASWSTWTRKRTVSFRPWTNFRLRRTQQTWGCPTCIRPPRKSACYLNMSILCPPLYISRVLRLGFNMTNFMK